ncbi:carbohydrate kinase family protein [Rhizomonospora bruguierae]|uniref:carbohydrate kinase family protein n=1 Tax=Rhizomonospora bruguierae TaxID=1581705 RepID=UPI001BCB0AC1|nr:sugar kinase [Micromonospora sp. NBRC 107566]
MNRRVVVVGDLVTDVLAAPAGPVAPGTDTPAHIRVTGGGQAANTAVWLAAAGTPVTLVAVVGDDTAGRTRRAELADAGVDRAVRACAERPTGTIVVLAGGGDRTMLSDRGATLSLTSADIDAGLTPDAGHLHLSGYPVFAPETYEAARHALAAAHRQGMTTSVDAASAAPLRQFGAAAFLDCVRGVDLLLANEDEAETLTGSADPAVAGRRLAETVGVAVVKLGRDGALWCGRDGTLLRVPAEAVDPVDATGAGDAFAAGLLACWTAGGDPTAALRAGAHFGARAVTSLGARPADPSSPGR